MRICARVLRVRRHVRMCCASACMRTCVVYACARVLCVRMHADVFCVRRQAHVVCTHACDLVWCARVHAHVSCARLRGHACTLVLGARIIAHMCCVYACMCACFVGTRACARGLRVRVCCVYTCMRTCVAPGPLPGEQYPSILMRRHARRPTSFSIDARACPATNILQY